MRCLLVIGCAAMLSGCVITPMAVTAALVSGISMYCVGVTDAGKQAVRDSATGGTPIIACPGVADE